MNRRVQFIQTNSNVSIREYVGPVCEIRNGVWKLTPALRTFLEQLIVDSKGRSAKIRIEFLRDKDIIVNLSDL
ncbi:MAG: hypothetical protein A2231_11420 [Candidatus Firestonebacteria bacterium RIFOXYA2_FULL_40_8]|nr:MAG: hypothetical protein A2231_11420 [Candidatus Firestonebacteria bacterium RIFOXYA2_FULL_40_8]